MMALKQKEQVTTTKDNTQSVLKMLYHEAKYEEFQNKAHDFLEKNPHNKTIKRLYDKVKQKVEEELLLKKFKETEKDLSRYKQSIGAVRSVEEALYWIKVFIKNKEYRKALQGCKEILHINPELVEVKKIKEDVEEILEKEEKKFKLFQKKVQTSIEKKHNGLFLEEQKKESQMKQLKSDMQDYMEIHDYKKVAKIITDILSLDANDSDALNARIMLEKMKSNQGEELYEVTFSPFKKWKRYMYIYGMKGRRVFENSAKKITELLAESKAEKLRKKALSLIKDQKDNNLLAAKIQKNIIAKIDKYTLPGFDVWGDTIQSDEIGGDSFNFINRDKDNVFFYMGDASGHGVRASLFASQVNLILRQCLENNLGLVQTAVELNKRMSDLGGDNRKDFMTMILFNWSLKDKNLNFVGVGHEYIIHYKTKEQQIELIPSKGIAIGMVKDILPLVSERQLTLDNQDILFLYSDGVTEAQLKQGDTNILFGIDRLCSLIKKYAPLGNSKMIYSNIMKELGEQTNQKDDTTLLVLRRDERSDLVYEEDLRGIESVDFDTLKDLSRSEVSKSINEIGLEQKTKKLIMELRNLMRRGEYNLIINRCIDAINQDKIYNKEVNLILKKARYLGLQLKRKEKKELIDNAYRGAKMLYAEGNYIQAKIELIKVLKMDDQNKNIRRFLDVVEKKILKEGNHQHKKNGPTWVDKFTIELNKFISPVSKRDDIDFIVKLSNLVNSGIKVKDSLVILMKQAKKPALQEMFKTIIANLEKGNMLSYSMASYPKVFSNIQINLIKAGEESGNLGNILKDLSIQLEDERDLRRKITGALIYPIFIVSFSVLLVVFMMIFIVPLLAAAYKEANLSLPGPTLVVISISNFIQQQWYVVVLLVTLFFVFLSYFKETLFGQLTLDKLALKIPVLKDITIKENIFLFSNSLSMLLDSGILMLESMNITADVVKNIYYKRDITRMKSDIIGGQPLSKALGVDAVVDQKKEVNPYFPVEVAQMVQVGETTGQISKMLRNVGENYQNDVKQFAKNFSTIIEPFLIVFIGVMVGALLLAVMLPFFEFGKAIKNL